MRRTTVWLALFAALLLTAAGCAKPKVERCPSPEDNPDHHYLRGMELVEAGRLDEARPKFERAVYCDPEYGPGYAGVALTTAGKVWEEKGPEYRNVDVYKAYESLADAEKRARTDEDEFHARVAHMRVDTTIKRDRDWLKKVEGQYKKAMNLDVDERAILYYDGMEAATYFMGEAYLEAKEFDRARERFSEVLRTKKEGKWNAPSDRGWRKADKIVRALGGLSVGEVGREIALRDKVTRADMAALLVDELKIDKLFAGRIPVKSEVVRKKAEFTPADVTDHTFREEVLTLMKWGVRGLEPSYDNGTRAYLFRPGEPVARKEFAMAMEDVLIKVTGKNGIATAYYGHASSPFPDVQPTSAWYNAAMNMTTRGLMQTELSGEFRPDDPVDGAEALLAIRLLRQRLNVN